MTWKTTSSCIGMAHLLTNPLRIAVILASNLDILAAW